MSLDPVKLIMSMPGCSTSASPMREPRPVTTWRTPPGMPASTRISPTSVAASAPWVGGFSTTAFPAASAGAILEMARLTG